MKRNVLIMCVVLLVCGGCKMAEPPQPGDGRVVATDGDSEKFSGDVKVVDSAPEESGVVNTKKVVPCVRGKRRVKGCRQGR